jgi:hypothetical protein
VGQEETEHAVRGHAVEADRGCGADPDPGSLSENSFRILFWQFTSFISEIFYKSYVSYSL